MKSPVYILRIIVSLLVIAAIIATLLDAMSRAMIVPMNFFGYFTIQSNSIFAVIFALSGFLGLADQQGGLIQLLRAAATTYIVLVGIVYGALLAPLGEAGGVPVAWANIVLHMVAPVYAIFDWIIVGDRVRLPLSWIFLILLYPIVWTGVVLYRGQTDGWVPYPFLDPAQGAQVLAQYVIVIAIVFAVIGLIVLLISRSRGVIRLHAVER